MRGGAVQREGLIRSYSRSSRGQSGGSSGVCLLLMCVNVPVADTFGAIAGQRDRRARLGEAQLPYHL